MILGIDLGTTHSLCAYINRDDKPEIIINERGDRLTPSVVYFKSHKEAIVGESAYGFGSLNSDNFIENIKRKMGSTFRAVIAGREFTPTEISSIILRKIKSYAEQFLNTNIKDIVISVPAYFSHLQRSATKNAAEIAGFNVLKIINEPTAAALAYNLFNDKDENILVFDLGGGTLDITLLEYKNRVQRVIATAGDIHLGGVDFDNIIVDFLIKHLKKRFNVDISNEPISLYQIKNVAKKAKEDLSSIDSVEINVPYVAITEKGPVHLRYSLSSTDFEKMSLPILTRIKMILENIFKANNISPDWVSKIIFVGGSTRIPFVRKLVLDFFANFIDEPHRLLPKITINPDEAVALGAAIYAGILEGKLKEIEFYDVVSHYLGIENDNGDFVPILEPNTPYNTEKDMIFEVSKESNNDFIKVHILQSDNKYGKGELLSLGYFYFDNPKELEEIDIIFYVDKHGILHVKAIDLEEGFSKEISIRDFYFENDEKQNRGSKIKIY